MTNKTFGFTGTRSGMTREQQITFLEILTRKRDDFGFFVDGMCVGSDTEANLIAFDLGYWTVGRPGHSHKNPESLEFRGEGIYEEEHESETFFARNRKIVKQSDVMLATPYTDDFSLGGGTNYTINYAIKQGKQLVVILPSGKYNLYNF